MSSPRFDLVDIVQTIRKHRRFVLIVTTIALVVGVLFFLTRKKAYTSEAQFFVSNPLMSDRNSLYGGSDARLDYFADEDDIDRVIALAESDTVVVEVIKRSGLDATNKLNVNDPKELNKLKNIYLKNLKVKRTEYTMMEVTYTDPEPDQAAKVANVAVQVIENAYRSFYNTRRSGIFASLQKKFNEQDSVVRVLTDTLAKLRDESGIYDLISPNRNNLVTSAVVSRNPGPGMGIYVEQIQNVEAIKDGIVIDQTRITTLLQQFSTGTNSDELKLFHIISTARPPLEPKGPGIVIIAIASILLGFFFSVIYILLTTYYKILVRTER